MATTPPIPTTPEQRLLAVVVFTDVVGYTARMQADEANTLKLLEQDFAVMRKSSKALSGKVLKTTGDGLLLYFTSAVRAMAWAVRTQRQFGERARTEPASEILLHRVGVHLGDVFIKSDDVMGDGVNIAARLLAEAPPGGICLSQTVYEVVRNKLKLNVVRLELRQLKNVKDPVQMYHVMPDAPQRFTPAAARPRVGLGMPTPAPAAALPPPAISRNRKLAVAGLVMLTMGVVALLVLQAHYEQEEELARSQATGAALGVLLSAKGGSPPGSAAKPDPGTPATSPPAAGEIDFARMTLERETGGPAKAGDEEAVMRSALERTQTMIAWLNAELTRFTENRGLLVPLGGSGQKFTLFTDAAGRLNFGLIGATRPRPWQTLKAEEQGAIVVSALRDARTPPPREVVRGAEAFAYVNRLPEMARALLRERRP